jgi:hypothetical protein
VEPSPIPQVRNLSLTLSKGKIVMHHHDPHMKECIDNCNNCRDECEHTLFQHCMEMGGKHTEQNHVKLMADCIEICQTAANFMLRGSDEHTAICATCADICEACAESCKEIGGKDMEDCADTCRKCAASCREMSQGMKDKSASKAREKSSGMMA